MSFSQLISDPQLHQALLELNYQQPTAIQSQAIPMILAGRDVMAGAQTGTGKTAAFLLPMLQRLNEQPVPADGVKPVRGLVLTPTRELAVQVEHSFQQYAKHCSLTAAVVYGGVSIAAQVKRFKQGVDVIVATPGRLLDHLRQGNLTLNELSYLVFDEADRMLDMGFADEINGILQRLPSKRQTLLFSATFDDAIFKLSKRLLTDPVFIEVDNRNSVAAPVEQIVYAVDDDRKVDLISFLLKKKPDQQSLIFSRTKQGVDQIAKQLQAKGLAAHAFHGDLSQAVREQVLNEFKMGDLNVLVATDVAARGLDIAQLGCVINMELPFVAQDYVHRIGRTGRAGQAGLAITLLSPDEEWRLEEIELLIDQRLAAQWLAGFEPDLTKSAPIDKKNSRGAQKRRAKKRAFGNKKR
ncbi:DEAD/DEAH box helicase [Motilimonas sp. E26]|uniref:DEAD/DEAH box helicase n=1 Tax=Motilimonas sp. E26 TaxID=2865674 RepID=UPI001E2F74A5|nr:DEAD/DEAH box helicase [Motilimonas sp. E26]MCE0555912.1 DEAD/DEAH box helicase [Motilimonas sp. E26]